MRRLLPSSLFGQVMTSVALALLTAQIVSVLLLYRAGEERRETAAITAVAFRLVGDAERLARREAIREELGEGSDAINAIREAWRAARERRQQQGDERDSNGAGLFPRRQDRAGASPGITDGLPLRLRYTTTDAPPTQSANGNSEGDREARLRAALAQEGVDPVAVAVDLRPAGEDPVLLRFAERRPRLANRVQWRDRVLYVASIQREHGAQWETARLIEPERRAGAVRVLVFQTLVIFGVLLLVLFLVLRRITRPLAQLTERVDSFSRHPDRTVRLRESGPSDTRRLIAAHNAMETRISALLDEKDVMLGAIGHDLKTPLAALRVRIESVLDEGQRIKMAESIEDITATLDDILTLARVGRSGETGAEDVNLAALAIGVVEEFEDLGEPVTITDPPRLVARVQVTWIKRAVRNLVSNALRYGKTAHVSVLRDGGETVLRVDDTGAGIPDSQMNDMLEPFTRGEASRNRATGGAGLGLALARAIAEQHGGRLILMNREGGGLRAEIRLPADG